MSDPDERSGRVLTTRQAAEYCGLAHQTFRNLLSETNPEPKPKRFKQGRLNAFYPVDLDRWVKGRLTDPDASKAA